MTSRMTPPLPTSQTINLPVVVLVMLVFAFPPASVLISQGGWGPDARRTVVLTLFGYIPGVIHALAVHVAQSSRRKDIDDIDLDLDEIEIIKSVRERRKRVKFGVRRHLGSKLGIRSGSRNAPEPTFQPQPGADAQGLSRKAGDDAPESTPRRKTDLQPASTSSDVHSHVPSAASQDLAELCRCEDPLHPEALPLLDPDPAGAENINSRAGTTVFNAAPRIVPTTTEIDAFYSTTVPVPLFYYRKLIPLALGLSICVPWIYPVQGSAFSSNRPRQMRPSGSEVFLSSRFGPRLSRCKGEALASNVDFETPTLPSVNRRIHHHHPNNVSDSGYNSARDRPRMADADPKSNDSKLFYKFNILWEIQAKAYRRFVALASAVRRISYLARGRSRSSASSGSTSTAEPAATPYSEIETDGSTSRHGDDEGGPRDTWRRSQRRWTVSGPYLPSFLAAKLGSTPPAVASSPSRDDRETDDRSSDMDEDERLEDVGRGSGGVIFDLDVQEGDRLLAYERVGLESGSDDDDDGGGDGGDGDGSDPDQKLEMHGQSASAADEEYYCTCIDESVSVESRAVARRIVTV